MDIKT